MSVRPTPRRGRGGLVSVAVLLARLAMAQTHGLQAGLEVAIALQLIGNTFTYRDAAARDDLSEVTVVSMQAFLREHDTWYAADKTRYEARLKDEARDLETIRASLRSGQWCRRADDCHGPLIQELSNMAQIPQVNAVREASGRGELARDVYVERIERLELQGVRLRVEALDACRAQLACPAPDLAHLEFYGAEWDRTSKAAYERLHPAP